jgi:predicted amidohydrolase YtcJ
MIMHILVNAQFHSLKTQQNPINALAVRDGRILALGSNDEMRALASPGDPIEDMQGRFILPAFCDAHIHLLEYGRSLSKVDCETFTLEACLENVRHRVEETPPGQWVLGHGWNHNNWAEGFGNAKILDEISSQHPIYLTAKSLHTSWANSTALKLAGIDASSADPESGIILRDPNGQPTGILLESAAHLVEKVLPEPTAGENSTYILLAQTNLNKFGITSIHDFDTWDVFPILQNLDQQALLTLRVVKGIPQSFLPKAIERGLRSGQRSGNLQIGWLKLFSDGALGQQTAALLEPYADQPGNSGMLMMDADEIVEIGRLAVKNRITLAIHAIGDRANRVVLDAYRNIRKIESRLNIPHRHHRIEHVQLIQPNDQKRLAELGILASMQPIHALSDMDMAERYWGIRCANAYAWKSLLNNHASLIFGSDAPVESPNPFLGLAAAISRRRLDSDPASNGWYTEECLTFEQAFQAFTIGPAYAAGSEDFLGKLAPGFDADLILLKENPYTLSEQDLAGLLPEKTMMKGEWVWEKG